jgi:hypothetical protein
VAIQGHCDLVCTITEAVSLCRMRTVLYSHSIPLTLQHPSGPIYLLCWLQVGLDDVLHTWYREQQTQQAHSIAASCSAAACRASARTGVPASARPWVWAAALGLPASPPNASNSEHCGGGSSGRTGAGPQVGDQLMQGEAAQGQRNAWWHMPNQRDKEKLEVLCNAVKQQVCQTNSLCTQHCADNPSRVHVRQREVAPCSVRAIRCTGSVLHLHAQWTPRSLVHRCVTA